MLNENAYKTASLQLQYLRRHKDARALWIVGGNVVRTPNTDWDIRQMEAAGAALVGVFTAGRNVGIFASDNPSIDLAEAIIAADVPSVRG